MESSHSSNIVDPRINRFNEEQRRDQQQDLHLDESRRSSNGRKCCQIVLSDRMIRGIFLLLGVGVLIPWNAFVSAKPYFTERFCQSGHDKVNFEQWFGLLWNSSSVISLGLIIAGQFFSDFLKRNHHLSSREAGRSSNDDRTNGSASSRCDTGNRYHHVVIPLAIYATVFSAQAVLVMIPDVSSTTFLVVTFVGLAVCGTCGALATAGIIFAAGLLELPQIGINPFFSGQAIGGVAVSVANLGVTTIGQDPVYYAEVHCKSTNHSYMTANYNSILPHVNHRMDTYILQDGNLSCSPYTAINWAVFCYFSMGCIILIFCIFGYHQIYLYQNMKHRDDDESLRSHVVDVDETSLPIGLEMNNRINDEEGMNILFINKNVDEIYTTIPNLDQASTSMNERMTPTYSIETPLPADVSAAYNNIFVEDNEDQIEHDGFIDEEDDDNIPDTKSVMFLVKGPAMCVFLTFTVTLTLFPSWVSELKSNHECSNRFRLQNDLFVPFCFVLFNIGDLVGRVIAEKIPVGGIGNLSQMLVVGAFLRIALLPLFLICRSTVGVESNVIVRSDLFSILVQLLFAVSNGLLVSTSFMLSPKLVGSSTCLQERASEIMTLSLYLGLVCGSFLAFAYMKLATRILS